MANEGDGPVRQAKPAGAAGTAAQRRGSRGKPAAGGGGRPQQGGILQFYSEDSPGFQVGPNIILIFSLSFIGCVVLLHIWGKLRG
ncbi:transporter Sec61 subunit beta [Tribonema minus]|uniref:Transporter Sec61 subunit beta n=1 Tax=Tribonema minus TaxID=303371 RepID=A0A835YZ77_9STRA|nr:transporter Sec61 subunit beta [Tribonema minus]